MTRITEMFSDPLLLFAERSPGGRGPGALLSTKTGLKPHERVLSSVRDRPDVPPEAGSPVFSTPQALESPADTLPGQAGGPPTSGPPFSNTPFFYPGPPPEGAPPPGTPPGGTPPGGTPPQGPPDTPTTPPTGPPPDTIPIPEPATWLMLVAGIVAIGAAARRRRFN